MKGPFIIRDKRILILFLIAWVCFMFFAFKDEIYLIRTADNSTGKWLTVTHPIYDFTISYPDKWTVSTFGEGGKRSRDEAKLVISGHDYGFYGIIVELIEADAPTLEDAAQWDDRRLRALGDAAKARGDAGYRNIVLQEELLNDVPILRRSFRLREGQFEAVYIVRAHDFIVINLRTTPDSYEKYRAEFERVVASFQPMN